MSEIDNILRDPSAAFADPSKVVCQTRLSHHDKVRILQQWRRDLVQLQVASTESLTGDTNAGAGIREIDECLRQLKAAIEHA